MVAFLPWEKNTHQSELTACPVLHSTSTTGKPVVYCPRAVNHGMTMLAVHYENDLGKHTDVISVISAAHLQMHLLFKCDLQLISICTNSSGACTSAKPPLSFSKAKQILYAQFELRILFHTVCSVGCNAHTAEDSNVLLSHIPVCLVLCHSAASSADAESLTGLEPGVEPWAQGLKMRVQLMNSCSMELTIRTTKPCIACCHG